MKLYNHEVLAVGGLKPKSEKVGFMPDPKTKSIFERVRAAGKTTDKLGLLWILQTTNGKIVPQGVGLVTTKQIIAPLGGVTL